MALHAINVGANPTGFIRPYGETDITWPYGGQIPSANLGRVIRGPLGELANPFALGAKDSGCKSRRDHKLASVVERRRARLKPEYPPRRMCRCESGQGH